MHIQKLPSITSLQFPLNNAVTVSVSEFSSKIFVFTLDGRLCTFNRKVIDVPGKQPKIYIQHVLPDRQFKIPQSWWTFIGCSPTAPKAYLNLVDRLCVINTDTGETIKEIPYEHSFGDAVFTRDGSTVYVPLQNGTVKIYSAKDDSEIDHIDIGMYVSKMVFSLDGKRMIGFSDKGAVIVDTASRKVVKKVPHPYTDIPQICITYDGKKIYVPQVNLIFVIDPDTLEEVGQVREGFLAGGIASSTDHPYVASCSDALEIINSDYDEIVDRTFLFGSALIDVAIDKYQISYVLCNDKLVVARYY